MNNSDERDYDEEAAVRDHLEQEAREELAEEWSRLCPTYVADVAHLPHIGCKGITPEHAYPTPKEN